MVGRPHNIVLAQRYYIVRQNAYFHNVDVSKIIRFISYYKDITVGQAYLDYTDILRRKFRSGRNLMIKLYSPSEQTNYYLHITMKRVPLTVPIDLFNYDVIVTPRLD
jgi:hypothetical protein